MGLETMNHRHVSGIPYRCPCCQAEYADAANLGAHLRRRHPWALSIEGKTKMPRAANAPRRGRPPTIHRCPCCDFSTPTVDGLSVHVHDRHAWARQLQERYPLPPPPPPAVPDQPARTTCYRCADPIVGRGRGAKYCCDQCRRDAADEAWQARRRAAGLPATYLPDAERPMLCARCDEAPVATGLGRFCSPRCRAKFGWQQKRSTAA